MINDKGKRYGHVAYVESVNEDGSFNVSQMDYYGKFGDGVSTGRFSMDDFDGVLGFIYETYAITDIDGRSVLRWHGDNGHFAFCDDGDGYYVYAKNDSGTVRWTPVSVDEGRRFCDQASAFGAYDVDLGVYRHTGVVYSAKGGYFSEWINGNHTLTPQSPTPHPTPNLTQDTDILVGGIERKAERGDTLRAGEVVTVRTTICATGGNTADARHKSGAKTDTHFAVRLPGTDWQTFAREETKDSNLTKGKCHAEQATYTVPQKVGQTIAFRATIDARDEITETNEDDNTSRDEVFTILEPPYVDLVGHSLAFVQAPTYAGDHARIRAAVSNNGTGTPHSGIRSAYSVQCPGTGWITLTDDGTDTQQLTPGATAWEETVRPVTMPHATGRCTLRWCVDSANAVAERNEGNNCTTQTFTLHPRPAPDLAIEWASDKKGCCTTKRKKKFYPRAGIANYGSAAPTTTVEVHYFLRGPGTGNNWWDMGNVDHLPPHELAPGARRQENIGKGWRVPKHFAKGWHEIRACINANPWGSGHAIAETTYGNNCKSYWRYVK